MNTLERNETIQIRFNENSENESVTELPTYTSKKMIKVALHYAPLFPPHYLFHKLIKRNLTFKK